MTVSGQRTCAENVAATAPTQGQRQHETITIKTPLPIGWGSFCSNPSKENPGCWYATAPWDADTLNYEFNLDGDDALEQTVTAETWQGLHAVVQRQVERHKRITGVQA
ncbi:hypothetical protein ACQEV9_15440 [Streptomyces chartreusis]|uniref:hypothetical protein n=1 Tax=Streptomyces chartreusis TaxID=1969 RepID=UPI003D8F5DBF